MEQKTYFCEQCRRETPVLISAIQSEGTLKGERYTYQGKMARCQLCGLELYVASINDDNLRALYDAYRQAKNLISLQDILAIPTKYAIDKRSLSLLLGWDKQTFSRYCEGDAPTKLHSDILQKIYEHPRCYNEILEQNKANLLSESTYRKSKKAVLSLLHGHNKTWSNLNRITDYLLSHCVKITPLALQKALYYIQGFYFAFYNEYLFKEDCQAWLHGPVYRDIYIQYRDCLHDAIQGAAPVDKSDYSKEERAIIDNVIAHICCYSGRTLEQFTHAETPWQNARRNLPEEIATDCAISKKEISDYFCAVKTRYHMNNPQDIKKYAQDMFQNCAS